VQNPSNSLVTSSFPDETPEMYYWRGDYGLLDRLSYRESGEIPRNWKMTILDPETVQARIGSGPPTHFSQSSDVHLLSDHPHVDDRENDTGHSDNIQPESQPQPSADSYVNEATASTRDAPKPKRQGLVNEVSNLIEDGSTKR